MNRLSLCSILCVMPLLSSCTEPFESKIYGHGDQITIEIISNDNIRVYGVDVYTKAVASNGLVEEQWNINYKSGFYIFEDNKLKKIVYGVIPKGFEQEVSPHILKENKKYMYSIEAGRYFSLGCFEIKNKMVVQLADQDCQ